MKLVRKLFFQVSLLITSVILIIVTIFYYSIPIYSNHHLKRVMQEDFYSLTSQMQGQPLEIIVKELTRFEEKHPDAFVTLIDEEGKMAYPRETLLNVEEDSLLLKTTESQNLTENIMSAEKHIYILNVQYALPLLQPANQWLLSFYPFVILVAIMLIGLLAFIYSYNASKRINYISLQTSRMKTLEPGISCNVEGSDEISQLSHHIDDLYIHLLNNISQLEQEKNYVREREKEKITFLRLTAHQLKTPITRMVGIVEGLQYQIGDFKNQQKYFQLLHTILDEQAKVVRNILNISALDIRFEQQTKPIHLENLVTQVLVNLDSQGMLSKYQIKTQLNPCILTTSKTYLEQIVYILMENAIKYSANNGLIEIELDQSHFLVRNQMSYKMDSVELDQLTEPFYRSKSISNQNGSGLGLFMLKQILNKFDYDFDIQYRGEWFEFTIYFKDR